MHHPEFEKRVENELSHSESHTQILEEIDTMDTGTHPQQPEQPDNGINVLDLLPSASEITEAEKIEITMGQRALEVESWPNCPRNDVRTVGQIAYILDCEPSWIKIIIEKNPQRFKLGEDYALNPDGNFENTVLLLSAQLKIAAQLNTPNAVSFLDAHFEAYRAAREWIRSCPLALAPMPEMAIEF